MVCDNCKKSFDIGNRPNGIPNGVGMVTKAGQNIVLCADCIIKLGQMDSGQIKAFFEKLSEKGSEQA